MRVREGESVFQERYDRFAALCCKLCMCVLRIQHSRVCVDVICVYAFGKCFRPISITEPENPLSFSYGTYDSPNVSHI